MGSSIRSVAISLLLLPTLIYGQAQCPNNSQGVDPAVFETCIPAPTSSIPVQCPTETQGIDPEVFSGCVLAPGQTTRVVPTPSATASVPASATPTTGAQPGSSATDNNGESTAAAASSRVTSAPQATNAPQTASSTLATVASSSTGGAAGAGVDSAAANNGSDHHYRNTVIIPAVVASIVGALLIAAIILCCLFLRRRKKKRQAAAGVRIDSPPSEDEKRHAVDPVPVPTPIYDTHRQQAEPKMYPNELSNANRAIPVQQTNGGPIGSGGISSGPPLAATAVPFMTANSHEDSYRPGYVPASTRPNVASSPTRTSMDSPTAKPWAAQPLRHFRRESLRDSNVPPPLMTEVQPGTAAIDTGETRPSYDRTSHTPVSPPTEEPYAAYRPGLTATTPPPTGPLSPLPTSQQQVSQQSDQPHRSYYDPAQNYEDRPISSTSSDLAVPGATTSQTHDPDTPTRPEYQRGLSAVDEVSAEDDASFYSDGRRADGGISGLTSIAGSRRSRNEGYGGYDPSGQFSVSPEHGDSEQLPNSPALGSWLQSRGIDLSLNDPASGEQTPRGSSTINRKPVPGSYGN